MTTKIDYFPMLAGLALIILLGFGLGAAVTVAGASYSPEAYARATMIAAGTATAMPYQMQVVQAQAAAAVENAEQGAATSKMLIAYGGYAVLGGMGMALVAGLAWTGLYVARSIRLLASPAVIDLSDAYSLLALPAGRGWVLLDRKTGKSAILAGASAESAGRVRLSAIQALAEALARGQHSGNADWLGAALVSHNPPPTPLASTPPPAEVGK